MMLVRTPTPYSTESNRGFVLRVCEENGYERPGYLLKLLGCKPDAMIYTQNLRLDPLEQLLGLPQKSLEYMTYNEVGARIARWDSLLGHKLEMAKHCKVVRLWEVAFCPNCIEEKGFLDVFWELRLAVACPIHRRVLVSVCPHCGKRASWQRPGLLRCACGGSFGVVAREEASDSVVRLMSMLRAVTHELPKAGLTWDYYRLNRMLQWLYQSPEPGWKLNGGSPTALVRIQKILDAWGNWEELLREQGKVRWLWEVHPSKRYIVKLRRNKALNARQMELALGYFHPWPRRPLPI